MARRRMFSLDIVDTDIFLEMPQSAQNLYFHLGMRADDDGFVDNPRKIMKIIGACEDDIKILFAKQFIIPFESGICVIRHWKIHNYIQSDRYKETLYVNEKNQLNQDENGTYTQCIQTGYKLDTQVRLGKDSEDKDRKGKSKISKKIDVFLEYSQDNHELYQVLCEFEKMRNKKEKPLTDRAKKMLITKLNDISLCIEIQIKILEQSIFHTWDSVYPLKDDNNYSNNKSKSNLGDILELVKEYEAKGE